VHYLHGRVPGGDLMELLVVLSLIDEDQSRPLDGRDGASADDWGEEEEEEGQVLDGGLLEQEDVEALLRLYVAMDNVRSFTHYTDELALDRVCTRLGRTEVYIVRPLTPPEGPSPRQLLKALTAPECTGCEHLRLLLRHPVRFGIRRGLAEAVVSAFFALLWDTADPDAAKAHLVVLAADRASRVRGAMESGSVREDPPAFQPLDPTGVRERMLSLLADMEWIQPGDVALLGERASSRMAHHRDLILDAMRQGRSL